MALTFTNIRYSGLFNILLFGRTVPPVWYIVIAVLLSIALGYFLGSINFALVISKLVYKKDIRNYGSGNAGMTNMARTFGKKAAIFTLLGDMLKGIAAVIIAQLLMGETTAYLAMLFAVIGHSFPVYYGFRGGKGVAVAAGMALYLEPIVFGILLLIFLFILITTKYVSLSSIMVMIIYPFLLYKLYFLSHGYLDPELTIKMVPNIVVVVCSFAVSIIVIVLHRENIKRLRHGTENKVSFGKKKDYVKDAEEARERKEVIEEEIIEEEDK